MPDSGRPSPAAEAFKNLGRSINEGMADLRVALGALGASQHRDAAKRDACRPDVQLARIIKQADYLRLSQWITEQTCAPPHALHHAALELATSGITVKAMTEYAIRQVVDQQPYDHRCDTVRRLAQAYAAIHNSLGPGAQAAAAGGILRVVRGLV